MMIQLYRIRMILSIYLSSVNRVILLLVLFQKFWKMLLKQQVRRRKILSKFYRNFLKLSESNLTQLFHFVTYPF